MDEIFYMQIAQNVCWHNKVSFVSYEDTGVYIITKIICTGRAKKVNP